MYEKLGLGIAILELVCGIPILIIGTLWLTITIVVRFTNWISYQYALRRYRMYK